MKNITPKTVIPWQEEYETLGVPANYANVCVGYMVGLDIYETDAFLAPWRESGSEAAIKYCGKLRDIANQLRMTDCLSNTLPKHDPQPAR